MYKNCGGGSQAFGSQYFLMRSPSVLNSTSTPRNWRICFLVRMIIPGRLPAWEASTLPVPVTLKRFFAPDLVFSLGIWLSYYGPKTRAKGPVHRHMLETSVCVRHIRRHGSPLAGRRKAGFMAEKIPENNSLKGRFRRGWRHPGALPRPGKNSLTDPAHACASRQHGPSRTGPRTQRVS